MAAKGLRLSRQGEARQAAGGLAGRSAAARAGQRVMPVRIPGRLGLAQVKHGGRSGAKTQQLTGDSYRASHCCYTPWWGCCTGPGSQLHRLGRSARWRGQEPLQGQVERVLGPAGTARGQRHGASSLQAVHSRSESLSPRHRSGNTQAGDRSWCCRQPGACADRGAVQGRNQAITCRPSDLQEGRGEQGSAVGRQTGFQAVGRKQKCGGGEN